MKRPIRSVLIGAVLIAALPAFAQQSSTSPNAAPTSSAGPASSAPTSSPTPPSSAAPDANTPNAAASSTTAAATPASAPGTDKSGPSPELIKRAKAAGLHPETHNGKTQFCWEDASIGSRFTTKKCTDEAGVADILDQREAVQQDMRQLKTGTGSH